MSQVQSPQLRRIGDSEVFSPKNEFLAGKKVQSTFAIRRDSKSPRYEKVVTFDFSGVSEQQLIELSLYAVKVRTAALLRNLSPDQMLAPDVLSTVDVVADVIESERKSTDPTTAAIRSLQKALGVSEEVARATLENAKAQADKAKAEGKSKAGPTTKTLVKTS
jgi:hypothetical protein